MKQSSTPMAMLALMRRDFTVAIRHRSELANPVLFYMIIVSLFPLALGPEPNTLLRIAPGIILVASLLSSMLSLEALFRSDFEDGTLEQLLISPQPLWILVIGKILAHWCITGLPLIIITPLLGVWMSLPSDVLVALLFVLLLTTPILSFVGAIGVALTVGLRRGGVLLSLLVLPLYIPALIFAASAVDSVSSGLSAHTQYYVLGALLVLSATLSPIATAASLRISVE